MDDYRKEQALIYKLRSKYTNKFCFNKTERAGYIITNFAKKYCVPNVMNLPSYILENIPGTFRMRLKFSERNREQIKKSESPKPKIENKPNHVSKYIQPPKKEDDLEQAIKESLKELKDSEEDLDDYNDGLHKAIFESLNQPSENNTIPFSDIINISDDSDDSCNNFEEVDDGYSYDEEEYKYDYGEKDLEKAIQESLKESSDSDDIIFGSLNEHTELEVKEVEEEEDDLVYSESITSEDMLETEQIFIKQEDEIDMSEFDEIVSSIISPDTPEENEFHVCIDLRSYSKDPYQPVFIYGDKY